MYVGGDKKVLVPLRHRVPRLDANVHSEGLTVLCTCTGIHEAKMMHVLVIKETPVPYFNRALGLDTSVYVGV